MSSQQSTRKVELYPYQQSAVDRLKNGSILVGGVGSGKSRTSLAYYFTKVCGGSLDPYREPSKPVALYIITTARKRDTFEWVDECSVFGISTNSKESVTKCPLIIDSWNNIQKYKDIVNSFFIFDEQRVVGHGAWVKAFLKIVKRNRWILLSATPGDTWSDYIPVFIANGYYPNRTSFLREHVVYSRYAKYPKIEKYVNCGRLIKYRRELLVRMDYTRKAETKWTDLFTGYDEELTKRLVKTRFDPWRSEPFQDGGGLAYGLRRAANENPLKLNALNNLMVKHHRLIIFYSFDYELDMLVNWAKENDILCQQWNGHKHEPVPIGEDWVYLVQYNAGSEAWNCITTDTIVFFSQSYSYRTTQQAAGRIDRLNTPYMTLYYYVLKTKAPIDIMIARALSQKKDFNENDFVRNLNSRENRSPL